MRIYVAVSDGSEIIESGFDGDEDTADGLDVT